MSLDQVGFFALEHSVSPLKTVKGFVKAGAGETKFGYGGGAGGPGVATLRNTTDDADTLETGFSLEDWDPVLAQILSGEL